MRGAAGHTCRRDEQWRPSAGAGERGRRRRPPHKRQQGARPRGRAGRECGRRTRTRVDGRGGGARRRGWPERRSGEATSARPKGAMGVATGAVRARASARPGAGARRRGRTGGCERESGGGEWGARGGSCRGTGQWVSRRTTGTTIRRCNDEEDGEAEALRVARSSCGGGGRRGEGRCRVPDPIWIGGEAESEWGRSVWWLWG